MVRYNNIFTTVGDFKIFDLRLFLRKKVQIATMSSSLKA